MRIEITVYKEKEQILHDKLRQVIREFETENKDVLVDVLVTNFTDAGKVYNSKDNQSESAMEGTFILSA